jgi:DNA repair protein RecO (recombination protein O)
MDLIRTQGMVLRHFPFRESSDVVVFFSRRIGKIKLMAKGRKRPTSQLGAPLELFSRSEAVIYRKESRDIQTVKEARLIASYPELSRSYRRYVYASAVCEFVDRLLEVGAISEGLYDLAQTGLELFAREPEDSIGPVFDGFLSQGLAVLGHRPSLLGCLVCGARESLTHWSDEKGGILCTRCARNDPTASGIPGDQREILRALLDHSLPNLARLRYPYGPIRSRLIRFSRIHTGVDDLLRRFEGAADAFA